MDAEAMAPANWPAYVAGAIGTVTFVGIWWANFSRRQRDDDLAKRVASNAASIVDVGHQRELDKIQLTGALDAVEKTQERLIKLLQEENKELRDRNDEQTRRHTAEVGEFKTLIGGLRADVDRFTRELELRKSDYDKSRVEIHDLRGNLTAAKGTITLREIEINGLLTAAGQPAKYTVPA